MENVAEGDVNGCDAQPGQHDPMQFESGGQNGQTEMGYVGVPGMYPNMDWNNQPDFNTMAQMMQNGMGSVPNPMSKHQQLPRRLR